MLEFFFNKLAGPQARNFIVTRLTEVFSCEYYEVFKNTYLENICNWLCFCNSLFLSTIVSQIHTESLLHVQLSLQPYIFCVMSVDNKI